MIQAREYMHTHRQERPPIAMCARGPSCGRSAHCVGSMVIVWVQWSLPRAKWSLCGLGGHCLGVVVFAMGSGVITWANKVLRFICTVAHFDPGIYLSCCRVDSII